MEGALGSGAPQQVASFVYRVQEQAWSWSDDLFSMHGFAPGEVVPTTDLLLAHKHPEDVARAAEVIEQALATGEPYSSRHRLIDANGRERTVVVVGRGVTCNGRVVELQGYFVDVTQAVEEDAMGRATRAIEAAREHQGPLEQAKGALMVTLGLDADTAFALLAAKSQASNTKVHQVAEDLVRQISGGGLDAGSAEAVTDWLWGDPGTPMMGTRTVTDDGPGRPGQQPRRPAARSRSSTTV